MKRFLLLLLVFAILSGVLVFSSCNSVVEPKSSKNEPIKNISSIRIKITDLSSNTYKALYKYQVSEIKVCSAKDGSVLEEIEDTFFYYTESMITSHYSTSTNNVGNIDGIVEYPADISQIQYYADNFKVGLNDFLHSEFLKSEKYNCYVYFQIKFGNLEKGFYPIYFLDGDCITFIYYTISNFSYDNIGLTTTSFGKKEISYQDYLNEVMQFNDRCHELKNNSDELNEYKKEWQKKFAGNIVLKKCQISVPLSRVESITYIEG